MQFVPEETKSGWLTKLGGNALRKTWKRRWCEVKGNFLYYYRQEGAAEPSGVINLSAYNSIVQDSSATKKSIYCFRIEKIMRSSDSVRSSLSYRELKTPPTFIAYADSESELDHWIAILQKRVGERNIVDIVLDRLDLTSGGHKRQGSFGSLNSFYSRNGSANGSSSTLSSRRPSVDSMSLDTPSLDSRKSSIDSIHSGYQTPERSAPCHQKSLPQSQVNHILSLGLGQPILRKPASHSCLQDRRAGATVFATPHSRKLSLSFKESTNHPKAPVIMVHGDNSKYTSSPDAVYFPDREVKMRNGIESLRDPQSRSRRDAFETFSLANALKTTSKNEPEPDSGSPVTPVRKIFPSHLSD